MREFFRHALHAGTAGNQGALRLAGGTFGGRGDFIAALMAGQPLAIAMLHQPGGAVRAREFVAAGFA